MLTGASSRRSGPHPILRAAPPSRPAPSPALFEAAAQVRADARKSVQGRPSGPRPHPGRPARDGRFSAAPPLGELSGSVRQRFTRRPAGPRPPRRPDRPGTLRDPLRGGKTAPPRSPLPRQPPLTAPHTGAPASTPPGTDAESAPPEPILQACAMLGSVATPPQALLSSGKNFQRYLCCAAAYRGAPLGTELERGSSHGSSLRPSGMPLPFSQYLLARGPRFYIRPRRAWDVAWPGK
ncbi:hypothetical protein NDU88_006838 [Pleurodeles waltl]|uniref:Basic proline-rich protein-like n=1 Tax=Pleurodeles waltl TaxID=8319 RepID=A0AAV7RRA1_PLEWA|nr:hypothetical protein NDU88_006838 [Pleurodeles waltl]